MSATGQELRKLKTTARPFRSYQIWVFFREWILLCKFKPENLKTLRCDPHFKAPEKTLSSSPKEMPSTRTRLSLDFKPESMEMELFHPGQLERN
jgi:hypothetical protein